MTSNVQISYRDPAGRIFVVGGETFDDFFTNLIACVGQIDAEAIVTDFHGLAEPPAPVAKAGPVAAPAVPGAPGAPSCAHGPMEYFAAGVNRAGKEYGASYRCPSQDRASQCKAKWL